MKRSWVIHLIDGRDNSVLLSAVNEVTGHSIANIGCFVNGRLEIYANVKALLEKEGYDVHQHGSKWDSGGRMYVEFKGT